MSDLTYGKGVPPEIFDCIILTQMRAVIHTLHRILKLGGVIDAAGNLPDQTVELGRVLVRELSRCSENIREGSSPPER